MHSFSLPWERTGTCMLLGNEDTNYTPTHMEIPGRPCDAGVVGHLTAMAGHVAGTIPKHDHPIDQLINQSTNQAPRTCLAENKGVLCIVIWQQSTRSAPTLNSCLAATSAWRAGRMTSYRWWPPACSSTQGNRPRPIFGQAIVGT